MPTVIPINIFKVSMQLRVTSAKCLRNAIFALFTYWRTLKAIFEMDQKVRKLGRQKLLLRAKMSC